MIIALMLSVGLAYLLASQIDWSSMYGRKPEPIKIEDEESRKR